VGAYLPAWRKIPLLCHVQAFPLPQNPCMTYAAYAQSGRNTEAGMDFRADDGYDFSNPSVGICSMLFFCSHVPGGPATDGACERAVAWHCHSKSTIC
jgi:hypothetical protein